MSVTVKFKWNKPPKQIAKEITGGDQTKLFIAETWRRLIAKFVPMDTGMLQDNVEVYIDGDTAVIHYKSPYAHKVYEGVSMNFSKEKHPLATARWSDVAKQAGQLTILIHDVQKFIDMKVI